MDVRDARLGGLFGASAHRHHCLRDEHDAVTPHSDCRLEVNQCVVNGVMFITAAMMPMPRMARKAAQSGITHIQSQRFDDDASSHHNRGVGVWGRAFS